MTSHHPPHLFADQSRYFITASTYESLPLFRMNQSKEILREALGSLSSELGIQLSAWVILDNHYHLLLYVDLGETLKTFIQRLHGRTSFEINKRAKKRGRQVWHNYWDTLVESEADYWTRFNYIHYNPVKHGCINKPEEWVYSSYCQWLKVKGEEWMEDVLKTYPILDFLQEDSDYPAKASTPIRNPESRV
ncbi:MAG: transposase [Anaerolineales bacterium]